MHKGTNPRFEYGPVWTKQAVKVDGKAVGEIIGKEVKVMDSDKTRMVYCYKPKGCSSKFQSNWTTDLDALKREMEAP